MTSLDPREDANGRWHIAVRVCDNYAARCRLTLMKVFPGERTWVFLTSPGTWVEAYSQEAYEYLYERAGALSPLLPRPDMPMDIVTEFDLSSWEVVEYSPLRIYFPEDESIIHTLRRDIEWRRGQKEEEG